MSQDTNCVRVLLVARQTSAPRISVGSVAPVYQTLHLLDPWRAVSFANHPT